MLSEANDVRAAIAKIDHDFVKLFSLSRVVERMEIKDEAYCALVDDALNPHAIIILQGGMLCAAGVPAVFASMMDDLKHGRIDSENTWPPQHLIKSLDWQFRHEKAVSLFLNTVPVELHEAALSTGWEEHPDDKGSPPAYLYHFSGQPRFAELVKHDCRLAEGAELLDKMKLGISYDEQGYYTRMCLENGPSFVCEVDGEPVCWSCTHLNGTMGMIYTPEEHRRKGYAKSLAAFQIDHMLATEGFACCHVVEGNTASEEMVLGLGAKRLDQAFCWRSIVWPEQFLPVMLDSDENE